MTTQASMYARNGGIITKTASATLSDFEAGGVILINAAGGCTITLPAATGTGYQWLLLGAATQTGDFVLNASTNGADVVGMADLGNDSAGASRFYAAATSNTVTLNGTTKGGIKGWRILVTDFLTDEFHVEILSEASGTEATPFTAA